MNKIIVVILAGGALLVAYAFKDQFMGGKDMPVETTTVAPAVVEEPAPIEDNAEASPVEETVQEAAQEAMQEVQEAVEEAVTEAEEAAQGAVEAAETAAQEAVEAAEGAMENAAEAATEAAAGAMEGANAAAEGAMEAATGAVETATEAATEAASEAAQAVSETATETATEAMAAGAEEAVTDSPAITDLFSLEGFDYDKAADYIDGSELGLTAKLAAKTALQQAKDNPELLKTALDQVRGQLGL